MNIVKIFSFNPECFLRTVDRLIVISNPRLRYHVEVDAKTASMLIGNLCGFSETEWKEHLGGGEWGR